MSDLISRQDAIDAIMGEPTDAHYPSWYAQRIKLLPSAKPEIIACGEGELSAEPKAVEWIPVSEKPKDEERTYLVQLDSGGMCSCRWTNANPIWTELTTDWHWNIFDIPKYCNVVAWMDLEPYREDGEA